MQVKNVMTRGAQTVSARDVVTEAAKKMRALGVKALPVYDDGQLRGMLTDRDVIVRAVADGRHPNEVLVIEVMSTQPFYCHENDEIAAAVELMKNNRVRRLPVMDEQERLIGIVSWGDLTRKSGRAQSEDALHKAPELRKIPS